MGEYMISLGNQGEFDLIIEGSPSDLKLIDEKDYYWPKVRIRKRVNGQYVSECLTGVPSAALLHAIKVAIKYGKEVYISERNNITWPGKRTLKPEVAKKIKAFLGNYAYLFEREQGKGTRWIGNITPDLIIDYETLQSEEETEIIVSPHDNDAVKSTFTLSQDNHSTAQNSYSTQTHLVSENESTQFDKLYFSQELDRAQNGHPDAMLEIGSFYYYGIVVKRDEQSAAYWFKKLSELNCEYSPIADKFIARMYYEGSMPMEEQSYEKSYEYHLKSSEGDLYSAGQVGFMQTIGSGCQFNYKQTEDYLLSILDRLDNPRKDKLCRFYISHGEYKKAAEIYKTMVDTYPYAAYQLGLLYKSGVLNTPFMPDYFLARDYFLKAYETGYTKAAFEIGFLYFNPTGGFPKNFNKALKYFLIAASYGDIEAHYYLGYMYYHGHIKRNRKKAIEYFEVAANRGHIFSASNLARLYLEPEFLDYEKAFSNCSFAASCGDAPAQYLLGTMYLFGKGCEPDKSKAFYYLNQAAAANAPEAIVLLNKLKRQEL